MRRAEGERGVSAKIVRDSTYDESLGIGEGDSEGAGAEEDCGTEGVRNEGGQAGI